MGGWEGRAVRVEGEHGRVGGRAVRVEGERGRVEGEQ